MKRPQTRIKPAPKRKTNVKAALGTGAVSAAGDALLRSSDTKMVKGESGFKDMGDGSVFVQNPPVEVPVHHSLGDLMGHAAGVGGAAATAVALAPHVMNAVDYGKTALAAKGIHPVLNKRQKWQGR